MDTPVFRDDQHGTAIMIVAGLLNALEIQGKSLEEATLSASGPERPELPRFIS